MANLTTAELIKHDQESLAIDYALAVGLLDDGFAENLETGPASTALLRAAGTARLIILAGGVSFLTGRTFHHLLRTAGEPAWVAAFVLRTTLLPLISLFVAHTSPSARLRS